MFAFQVGDVSDADQKVFNDIWNNEDNVTQNGVFIGRDGMANLPKELMRVFKNMVKDIRI